MNAPAVDRRRPSLAILSLSPLARDGRVLRQVWHAAPGWQVTVVGWGPLGEVPGGVVLRSVSPVVLDGPARLAQVARMGCGRWSRAWWDRWYWRKPDHRQALDHLVAASPDVIHANEAIALPIAVHASALTGARVLFDAHEYSPDQFKHHRALRALAAPFYRDLLARYVPRTDAMITVAPTIAERYARELGRPCEVVLNAPRYVETPFRPTDATRVRLVHHGVALAGRELERLIAVIASSNRRFALDLMLVPSTPGYLTTLERLAERTAPGRVRFRHPVPPDEIVPAIADADMALLLIPPADFNYRHALPNKLFESLMAGLAIACGPSVEMARLVRDHDCGLVATDFSPQSMARALDRIDAAAIDRWKQRALAAARIYNAEAEMARLDAIYRRLLALGRRGRSDA